MKSPETPKNESFRLQTLRSLKILDTPQEERFDRITRIAQRIYDVPIALVSLIDENRQWFKSCVGLNATETTRDISFCGHSILGDEIFVIPDATQDIRFADNPLVLNEPNIRFYAGYPLKAWNGEKLGTLCIIDQKPRNFSLQDLVTLQDLGSMVESEMAAIDLAMVDDLTQLANRRGFMLQAEQNLELCNREAIPASLIFFDLNKFKSINDQFGHAEGDRALINFAKVMRRSFRGSDLLARLGGDEFAVFMPKTSLALSEDILARFKHALDDYNAEAQRGYDILFCHGIVENILAQNLTLKELMAASDSLMYQCKVNNSRPKASTEKSISQNLATFSLHDERNLLSMKDSYVSSIERLAPSKLKSS